MKTRILLSSIGAAVLAAFTLNVNASDARLTPRAAGNQVKMSAGAPLAPVASVTQTISPRNLGNQAKTVASTPNDVNPTLGCRNMVATPKTIQACDEHPAAMTDCCNAAH